MRIDSLDGLRAMAILSVLLLHHDVFNNGWMGVDLFFVLSGFLITQVLRKDRDQPSYWKPFYIKRATRILPPMVLAILLAYLFTPNATFFVVLGYLFSFGGLLVLYHHLILPLGQLWSLGVEEHFYLVWPFAVRFLRRSRLLIVLGAMIVVIPFVRLAFSHPMPMAELSAIYFLTPFRVDQMALGCLLAILLESQRTAATIKIWSARVCLLGIAVYLALWTYLHHIKFFPGAHTKFFDSFGYSLVGFICFWLIAYVRLNPSSWVSNALSLKPLAFIGRISYGIYLYHLLVKSLVMWVTGISSERTAFLLDFPLVLFVSWLSFKYYEAPIMRWGKVRAEAYHRPRQQQIPERDTPAQSKEPWSDGVVIAAQESISL